MNLNLKWFGYFHFLLSLTDIVKEGMGDCGEGGGCEEEKYEGLLLITGC